MIPTPKAKSTRLQLPVGPTGQEPANAPEGALAYAEDTELVRVKTSTGWEDVGSGGGGGTITEIDAGTGIAVTAGTGPVVTVATDLAAGTGISITGTNPQTIAADTSASTSPFVLKDLNANYFHDSTASRDDRVYLQDTVGNPIQSRVRELPVIEKDFSTYTFAVPSTASDIVYNINGSPGVVRTCNLGDLAVAGQVTGTLAASAVKGITETSGPTALTIGSVTSGQYLQRSGSTLIGATPLSSPTGNPYIDPPATAGLYDDEFDSGSPDLATRGWTVLNASNVAMTRVGDVQPWDVSASSLTNTQYLSTIVGSQILIQVSPGGTIALRKAITPPSSGSGALFWMRGGANSYASGASSTAFNLQFTLAYSSGGNADSNNTLIMQCYSTGATNTVNSYYGSSFGGSPSSAIKTDQATAPDIFGIKQVSGTTIWSVFTGNSANGATTSVPFGSLVSTSMAFLQLVYQDIVTGTGAPNVQVSRIFSLDFVRSASGASAWIGQTPRTGSFPQIAPTGNPYIDPPATPSSFDDEFDSGSADLATRGWTVRDAAGTTYTRSGDISPWDSSGPAAGTYWSSIRGSQIFIQPPTSGTSLSVMKAVSLTAGDTYFARVGNSQRLDSTVAHNFCEVGLYAASGSILDLGNRVYMSVHGTTTGAVAVDLGRQTASAAQVTTQSPFGATVPDIRGVRYKSGTDYAPFGANSGNGDTLTVVTTGAPAAANLVWFAVSWNPGATAAGNVPYMFEIDFVRKVTGNNWIAQTPRTLGATPPVGAASGDLSQQYPAPWVSAIHETSGPTQLTIGAIPNIADVVPVRRGSTLTGFAKLQPSMYEAYPSSPDAFNDEFDEGSSDLATRGWGIIQIYPTVAAMTRLGDVDADIIPPTAMSAGQYRSTLRNGKMYMQIGGNGGQVIYVYKASSGAFAYAANISASAFGGNAYGALMLVDTVAVPFASGGSKSALIERTNSSLTLQKFDAGTQIIYSNGTPAEPFRPLAFHVDWRTGGSGIYMTVTAADAETEMNAVAGQAPPASWTPLYAGVMLRNNNAGTRNWAVVDYIRRYTSGTFFPA